MTVRGDVQVRGLPSTASRRPGVQPPGILASTRPPRMTVVGERVG